VKSLEINSTPFTFHVVDGQVVAKAFLPDVDDYRNLAAIPVETAAAKATRAGGDVSTAPHLSPMEVLGGFDK
jgi:hypothetical protein